jgi:hypothetical protein
VRHAGAAVRTFTLVRAIGVALFFLGSLAAARPGDLLTSFGSAGVMQDPSREYEFSARTYSALDTLGRIYVTTRCPSISDNSVCVTRYNINGSIDSNFGTAGSKQLIVGDFGLYRASAIIFSGDQWMVGGPCADASDTAYRCVFKFNLDGSPTTGFGNPTGAWIESSTPLDRSWHLVGLPSGAVSLVFNSGPTNNGLTIKRLNASGTVEYQTTNAAAGVDLITIEDILALADGSLRIVGSCQFTLTPCVVAIDSNGVLISGYGTNGVANIMTFGGMNTFELRSAALQLDGRVLVSGLCGTSPAPGAQIPFVWSNCINRLTPTGAIDTTLDATGQTPGRLLLDYATTNNPSSVRIRSQALKVRGDGSLVFAFDRKSDVPLASGVMVNRQYMHVYQLHSDGTRDSRFGSPTFGETGAYPLSWSATGSIHSSVSSLAISRIDESITAVGGCTPDGSSAAATVCIAKFVGGPSDYARCSADIDGDGIVGINDSVLLSRTALGFRGNAVLQNMSFSASATRTTWPAIRDYLFNQCGMVVGS